MKKSIPPVTVVITILVVVVVVGALGYFFVLKPKGDDGGPGEGETGFEAMKQQMNDPAVQKMQQEQKAGAGSAGKYGFQ